MRVSIGVSLVSLAVLAGCSLTVDADRKQCTTDADCTKRGGAFAGSVCVASLCEKAHKAVEAGVEDKAWACLDTPPVTSTAAGPFHVTLHLTDIVSSAPLSGVTATLCRKLDVTCADPQAPAVTSDANGLVAFDDVPAAFSGYVSLAQGAAIMPGLYFFNPAVNSDVDISAVQLASPAIAAALTAGVGSKQQAGNGLMLLSVVDCTGAEAAGITFDTQLQDAASSVAFYSVAGLPNSMVTSTDSSGYGGLVNIPPGTVVVAGKRSDGVTVGTISLLVAAGTITYSKLVPVGQ